MSEISISFLAVSDLPIGARGGKGRPQDHRPSQPQPPLRDSSHSLPQIPSTISPLSSENMGAVARRNPAGGMALLFSMILYLLQIIFWTIPIMPTTIQVGRYLRVYRAQTHTFLSFILITHLGRFISQMAFQRRGSWDTKSWNDDITQEAAFTSCPRAPWCPIRLPTCSTKKFVLVVLVLKLRRWSDLIFG